MGIRSHQVSISRTIQASGFLGLLALVSSGVSLAADLNRSFLIVHHAEDGTSFGAEVTDITPPTSAILEIKSGDSNMPVRVRFLNKASAREAFEEMYSGRSLDISGCTREELVAFRGVQNSAGNYFHAHGQNDYTLVPECDGLMGLVRTSVVSVPTQQVHQIDLGTRPVIFSKRVDIHDRVGGMDLGKI